MIFLIKYKISQGKEPNFTTTVDHLADIFEVDIKDNSDRKRKITSILNAINKNLEITKFKFTYIKGPGEKWPYTIQFTFEENTLQYFDEKLKAIFTSQYQDRMRSIYLSKLNIPVAKHYLYKPQFKLGTGDLYQNFIDWMYSDEDKAIKQKEYRDLYIKILGSVPSCFNINMDI